MAHYKDIKIFQAMYILSLEVHKISSKFSRNHKYDLGLEIKKKCYETLDLIIEINSLPDSLKIEKLSRLPTDSRFAIKEVSLLGEKAVEIIPGHSKKYLQFGDTVKGEAGGGISQVLGKSESYGKRIDDILNNIDNLSGKETFSSLQNLIMELRETNHNLNDLIKGSLKSTISNINEIALANKKPVHTLLDTLEARAGDISLTIKNLKSISSSLDSVSSDLNSGRGTIGKLMQNDSIYHNMENTIQHLDSLILDIKQNPAKYFEVKVF